MQAYVEADQKLHVLSQVIAKINRTYQDKQDDDSHTNLCFDELGGVLAGRWMHLENEYYLPVFNLGTQHFAIWDKHLESICDVGIKDGIAHAEETLDKALSSIGFGRDDTFGPMHYEITDHVIEEPKLITNVTLNQWRHYRKLANESCAMLLSLFQQHIEVRIWPHHFDTGVYFQALPNLGMGFGLAMRDKMVNSPYFYLSGFHNNERKLVNTPKLSSGYWIQNENWKGAVLPLEDIKYDEYHERLVKLKSFIFTSVKSYMS